MKLDLLPIVKGARVLENAISFNEIGAQITLIKILEVYADCAIFPHKGTIT